MQFNMFLVGQLKNMGTRKDNFFASTSFKNIKTHLEKILEYLFSTFIFRLIHKKTISALGY